jgi:hypothetical protein
MGLPETELNQVEEARARSAEEALESAPKTVLSAERALEKIRRGELIQNVRIERLRFQGDFPLAVKMRNVLLVRPHFEGASFHAEVSLAHCTLDRPQFRRRNVFAHNLVLTGATLIQANLRDLAVHGTLACDNVHSRGKLLVNKAHFEGPVRFWEACFRGWVEFRDCDFAGEADFRSFHADEGFVLQRCRFAGAALFRGATVSKKWDAGSSRFEALLDFSKAKLHDYVYLEAIEQGQRQRFTFMNALAERILVRTEQLVGRIASEESRDYAQAMHEYAFLKRAFGSLHRYEQEDWAFYRFKVNQRRCCNRSWWRPWTRLAQFADWLLLDHGCGYCTNPYRAVRAALVIILGFGLVYMVGIENFHLDKKPFPDPDPDRLSLANRVMIGLLTSVSVFTSGLSGIRDVAKGWMNVPLIAESLLGTLLWGLFIVAFSRKVIR